MPDTVTLTIIDPTLNVKQYSFDRPVHCVAGRAEDCRIQLPADLVHSSISRHHCEFVIDPPTIRVRDLGSLNGTYVNAERIGLHVHSQMAAGDTPTEDEEHELKDGDEVVLGPTLIRVTQSGS